MMMKAVKLICRKKLKDKIKNETLLETLQVPKLEIIIKRQMLLEISKWGHKKDAIFETMNVKTRGNSQNKLRPVGKSKITTDSFLQGMKDVWNDNNHLLTYDSA